MIACRPNILLALLRAEAYEDKSPAAWLEQARGLLGGGQEGLEIYGPFPAPFEKRAGRYRFQVLIQAEDRAVLQRALRGWVPALENMKTARKIRWSLDVDPQELL